MVRGRSLARALGIFSLAVGIAQVIAPRRFAKWVGIDPRPERQAAVRAVGFRELGAAAGLLSRPRPVLGQGLRLVGDAMDLALLGRAMRARGVKRDRVTGVLAATAGVAVLDVLGGVQLAREATTEARRVRKAITVNRPRDAVYAFWRDFANFPRFMQHIEAVQVVDGGGRSHWKARAPGGLTVSWEAEIIEDRRDELIAWRSVEGSDVEHAGTVTFESAPAGRGTVVRVEMRYGPPGGRLGAAVAKLFGEEPELQVADDLRHFKQVVETGEVVLSEATLGERRLRQHPAQPLPGPIPAIRAA
jgi:uncharacterized membrane protein